MRYDRISFMQSTTIYELINSFYLATDYARKDHKRFMTFSAVLLL